MGLTSRILVVEDDNYWVDTYKRAIRNLDIEVFDAPNANRAAGTLSKTAFAGVIVDLEIPGGGAGNYGGFDVLNAIARANPYTEAVVITAHGEQDLLDRVTSCGVSLYMVKPVDFPQLWIAVHNMVLNWKKRFAALNLALDRFPICHSLMATRGHNRPRFRIVNEYDVQDLLHVVLKPFYPDIVAEEYSPKRGGKEKRLDFVIRRVGPVRTDPACKGA